MQLLPKKRTTGGIGIPADFRLSKQDPRLLQEVGDLSVYLTYYQKRCKLSTCPIKIIPIKPTGCHVVLRQRMEARARIKLARSHS